MKRSIRWRLPMAIAAGGLLLNVASASAAGTNVRLTHDEAAGRYVSAYTLATGNPYTDPTLDECSRSQGRQNEPAVAVDPRDTHVLIGSSNDYCGVYNNGADANGAPIASGPVWLGYYRSQDSGGSFVSSLVPGYPGDTSPYAALAKVRTASSGDPVIAWDKNGRVFMGSESSGDPEGTAKTFGDVWVARYVNPDGPAGATSNDGKAARGTVTVAQGPARELLAAGAVWGGRRIRRAGRPVWGRAGGGRRRLRCPVQVGVPLLPAVDRGAVNRRSTGHQPREHLHRL